MRVELTLYSSKEDQYEGRPSVPENQSTDPEGMTDRPAIVSEEVLIARAAQS
jgi:hypothetical protein